MGSIISDIQNKYRQGNICIRYIYINIGVFLLTAIVSVFLLLFNVRMDSWLRWFELPAGTMQFLRQPWSLFTYMFMHAGILHLVFNMLWLYCFGRLFLVFFSARHFRGLYLLGGFCGGLLYMAAYHIFPYFHDSVNRAFLLGASASVLAITVATAVREPEYQVNLAFIGPVRLKYIALVMVVTDLLMITSDNAGGHISHLGGALAGWFFAVSLAKGHDLTAWMNQGIDYCTGNRSFKRKPRKPKMEVHYGKHQQDYDYNAQQKARRDEIDRILDKLKQSGYDSLTSEEKKRLFDASKN